jgi:MoaA/NifB/PqqE/SkfB family radical SAM enzyme
MTNREISSTLAQAANRRTASVDRCATCAFRSPTVVNFRCVYCMPKEVFGKDYQFLEHKELLTFEEIARLARIFTRHGIEKIRLTGGEPLVRRNLERLIELLAAIPGLDLTLTTNASLLTKKAQAPGCGGSEEELQSVSTRSTTRCS